MRIRILLQILVSSALLAFLYGRIDWRAMADIWRSVDVPTASAASLLTVVVILLMALRWQTFLTHQGIKSSFSSILKLTWTGQFFTLLMPGSTGGDLSKIIQVCARNPEHKPQATASVFVDRCSALLTIILLAALAWFLGPSWSIVQQGLLRLDPSTWLLAVMVAGAACTALVVIASQSSGKWRTQWLRFGDALKLGFRLNANTISGLLLALVIHFLNFTIFYLFATSLGIGISYWQVLLMQPILFVILMVPVTVNGHGLREVLLIGYFTHFGTDLTNSSSPGAAEAVVSLTLLCALNDLIWSLPGGFFLLTPPAKQAPL